MKKYLRKFNTHSEYEEYINSQDKLLPNVSLCEDLSELHYNKKPHNYSQDYFTFVALESGTFTFTPQNNNVISYSIDNGKNWTQGNSVTVSNGDKILWKGAMTPASSQGIGTFSATGNFNIEGNAMSLLFGDNYKGQTDLTGKNYVFYQLFNRNTKVVNAGNLSLPATTLANHCYNSMFYGCTNLEIAPELPAMTLAFYCYNTMFCGCTNLRYIKSMFTTTPGMMYTNSWVSGVSATGTFVKNAAALWNVSGANGIPEGWEIIPPLETRVVAKFNITDTSNPTHIIGYRSTSQFSEIEIDDVVQSSIVSDYTFNTIGEHVIKYTLVDLTSIGEDAFSSCREMTSVTIPHGVTSIGFIAFTDCRGLTSITIPDSVTSIGDNAFLDCISLTSITIPNGVTSIGNSTFSDCSGLTSVTIPSSVTEIGSNTFSNCSGLTSITIPSGVTLIGGGAFYGCSNLTNITSLATTAPRIGPNTFEDVKTNGTLTVLSGSTGYNDWMNTGDYYLGKYGWNKIEQ